MFKWTAGIQGSFQKSTQPLELTKYICQSEPRQLQFYATISTIQYDLYSTVHCMELRDYTNRYHRFLFKMIINHLLGNGITVGGIRILISRQSLANKLL